MYNSPNPHMNCDALFHIVSAHLLHICPCSSHETNPVMVLNQYQYKRFIFKKSLSFSDLRSQVNKNIAIYYESILKVTLYNLLGSTKQHSSFIITCNVFMYFFVCWPVFSKKRELVWKQKPIGIIWTENGRLWSEIKTYSANGPPA